MRIAGRRAQGLFSQVTYCGGYSGEVPPLPIPNREVKLTHADGTDPPVGRVGSRRSSEALSSARLAGLLCFVAAQLCVAAALVRRSTLPAPLPSAYVLPAPLRRFAGICSALSAPLRRFGRGPRSQKKFARDPLPPPLHSDASEQGSSLREIRSEPCSSAFSAARLIFPFQLYFLRPESSSFGAGGCWHNVVPARK